MTKFIYLTPGTTTFTPPSDWGYPVNVSCYGADGAPVAGSGTKGGSGGGGGAFVYLPNYAGLRPGVTYDCQIGASGSALDTTLALSSFVAKAAVGAVAGNKAACVVPAGAGSIKSSGGAGGTEGTHPGGAGGGGAGGPTGDGAAGGAAASGGGAGGGGADGGSVGANGGTGHGAAGGNNNLGTGGGVGSTTSASPGGDGSGGGGGGGGNNDSPGTTCSNGGRGSIEALYPNGSGPGGGGAGAGGTATAGHNGGNGGNSLGYGGGGGGGGQGGSGGVNGSAGSGIGGEIVFEYTPNGPFPPPPPPPPPGIVFTNFQAQSLASLTAQGWASNGTGCWDETGNPVAAGVLNLSPQGFGLWCGPSRTQYLADPGNPTSLNWPAGVQAITLGAGTYTVSCYALDNSGVTITGSGIATTTVQTDAPYKFTLAGSTVVTFTQVKVNSNGSAGAPNLVWINCQGTDSETSPILAATAGSTGSDGQAYITSSSINFNAVTSSELFDWITDSASPYYAFAVTDAGEANYQPRGSIGTGIINPIYGTVSTSSVNPSVVTGLCNVLGLSAQNANYFATLLGGLHTKNLTTAVNPPGTPVRLYAGNGGASFVGQDMPGRFRRVNYYNLAETQSFLNAATGPVNVYLVGDSQTLGAGGITFGAGGTHENWGWQTYRKFARMGFPITINGVTGRGLVAPASPVPISDPATIATVNAALVSGTLNVLNCFFGINDLQHSITGNALYEDACSYYNTMYAAGAGWTVIILWTIPPGQGTPETQRAGAGVGVSFNDTLRWAFQNPGQIPAGQTQSLPVGPTYHMVDVGADPIIGQAGQNTNAIYYSTADNLHWNTYGLRYVAKNLFAPVINSILPGSGTSAGASIFNSGLIVGTISALMN